MSIDLESRVEEAAKFIARESNLQPAVGIVLGTGSGIIASKLDVAIEFDYSQIPHFPSASALGHKGRLVLGSLEGFPIVAMDGRFHLYEGHAVDDVGIGVRVMNRLGVEVLAITNAAGGLNPQYNSGDIMVIDSHIDLMWRFAQHSHAPNVLQRPTRRPDIYDPQLRELALSCGRYNDFVVHRGVYAALLGPNYESRAEYRMLRRIGADVAGMSTVPEVNVAAELGIRVLALSIVTNIAKPDVLEETSGQDVIDAAQIAAPRIYQIVSHVLRQNV